MQASVSRVIGVLERTRSKIRKGWVQRTEAADAEGNGVNALSSKATCFCTLGAVVASTKSDELRFQTKWVLSQVLPKHFRNKSICPGTRVIWFNDSYCRTKPEIIDMINAAIKRLKKDGKEVLYDWQPAP